MHSVRILGISGSLRKQSYNTALLREAKRQLEAAQSTSDDALDVTVDVVTLHGIPLYDGDVESEKGEPNSVSILKEKILNYDGVIFSTPEYNNGIPGVFKNTIDWLSRPSEAGSNIFAGRHVAVMGASPGGFGTVMAQASWLPVLKSLGARHWSGGRLLASKASNAFSKDGLIVDDRLREQLIIFIRDFAKDIYSKAP